MFSCDLCTTYLSSLIGQVVAATVEIAANHLSPCCKLPKLIRTGLDDLSSAAS